ncbi:MAG: hypothetical protein VX938_13270, partial [Myxococcota bacterium]|nr:hypothetical protein [Myxococcota bacterium]
PSLLKAAFIRTNTGGSIYMAARLALAKIGPGAAAPLVELAEGKNKDFQEFARKYGIQEWQWRYGPEMVQLLGDTLQTSVTPALAKNMTRELTPPMGISEAMQEKWRIAQMNRLRVAMLSIGHVGGNEGVEILSTLVGDARADTRNQRLGAATALALIGSDVAQDALIARYRDEHKTSMTKLLAEAFRQPMLQPLTLGLDHRKQGDFDKLIKKPSDYVTEGLKAPQVVAYLGVIGACKGETSCLIKQLKGENKHAAVKAAVLLARFGGKMGDEEGDLYATGDMTALRSTLVEHLESIPLRSVDAQRFTLIALTRIGDATTGDDLLRIAGELEDKSPAGKVWKTELEVFGNALKHRK